MLSIHSEQMYFMVKKKMRIPSSIGLGRIIRKCFHFPKGSKLFGSELFSHHTVCIVIFPCQVLMIVEATFLTLITGTTVMRQEKAARPTHVIKMKNVQRWIHNEKWWKIASADLKKTKNCASTTYLIKTSFLSMKENWFLARQPPLWNLDQASVSISFIVKD